MNNTTRVARFVAAAVLLLASPVVAAEGHLRGIIIDRPLDADLLPADVPTLAPTLVRLAIPAAWSSDAAANAALRRVDDALEAYRKRNIRVVLALGALPPDEASVEAWRVFIRAVAERGHGKVAAYQIGSVRAEAPPDVARYVYLLKLAAVQLRSVDDTALVLQGSIPAAEADWQGRVLGAAAGPYVDGVAIEGSVEGDTGGVRSELQHLIDLVQREKPAAHIVLGPVHLPQAPTAAASRLVDSLLRALGTHVEAVAFDGPDAVLGPSLAAATQITNLVAGDLIALDERTAELRILRNGANVTPTIPHRLVYSLTGFETYLVYWSPASGGRLDVEATIANATTPRVTDPLTGQSRAPESFQKGARDNQIRLGLPTADHALVVDFNFGNSSALGTSVEVQKERLPRVEEIVFRHQQTQAMQDAMLQTYIAHVRIEQHFHPSPADPAYNLITENRLFSDHGVVEWEELSFELNGAKWTTNRPPFPLVQPEKVLSLPLDLRLNQDYTYRLDGVDTVNGRQAYVVKFDPAESTKALYRGTVWIDRTTFARLKVQAVETKLSGPIVSNDETQLYEPSGDINGRPIWLLNRLVSKQIFLIAGRSVLIEREVHLSDIALNPAVFDQERSVARASNRVMYRDTDQGVRYLVKQGETRVVSDKMTTSARAFALGADIDPSFDYPLPIGGINILDFNFLKKNYQLALLYGGVIGVGNIQRANMWGGKFDVSADFFGLALKSNDDVFDATGKRGGERVNRIPVALGMNLGYQVSPFHKVTGHYEFKYDAYFRDATTAQSFAIPSSTATNGIGGGYEFRQRGYSLLANAAAYERTTWDPWGDPAAFDAGAKNFTKYDIGVSKDFSFKTFHTIHFNGTYFGGQRLDRFSMYQFGLFDATRMHGVPSAVRFAELGMFRGSYSFNLFEQYRLDLFLDRAVGRQAGDAAPWQSLTGTGVRVNFRAPRSTILQLDFGKSFLPNAYRGAGSTVVQILLLKPL
jgi:hypothetical protein